MRFVYSFIVRSLFAWQYILMQNFVRLVSTTTSTSRQINKGDNNGR